MKTHLLAAAALILAVGTLGAQAAAPAPEGSPAAPKASLEIWQVDLVPTGSGFAVTKPVLDGDAWVFKAWPDRASVRVPATKIKKITPRTRQLKNEVIYKLELAPTGTMLARDKPVLKGTTYTFHAWQGGSLMSLRQPDVKSVARLTEAEMFQVHLQRFGLKPIGHLAMEGGTAVVIPAPGESGASAGEYTGGGETPYNWIYEGTPGIDDAWAPPSAVVAYPGDVPKAPE
jgi:hypothetical protein